MPRNISENELIMSNGLHLDIINAPIRELESYSRDIEGTLSETQRALEIIKQTKTFHEAAVPNAVKTSATREEKPLEGDETRSDGSGVEGLSNAWRVLEFISTGKFLYDGMKWSGIPELLPSFSQVAKSIPSFAEMRAASAAALAEDTIIAANARMLLNPITAALAMIPVTNYAYQKIYDTDENIWQGSKNFWAENDTAETLYKYHEGIQEEGGYALSAFRYYSDKLLPPSIRPIVTDPNEAFKNAKYFWAGNDTAGDVYEFLRATPDYIKSLLPDYLKKNKSDESVEGGLDERGDNSSGALGNMFSAFADFFSPSSAFAYDMGALNNIGNYHADSMRGLTDSAPESLAPKITVTVNQPPIQNKVNMLVNLYEDGRQYVETDLNTEPKIDVRRGYMD